MNPPLPSARLRKLLESSELRELFIEELMWDNCRAEVTVEADDQSFLLTGIAQKAGAVVFECTAGSDGRSDTWHARGAAV